MAAAAVQGGSGYETSATTYGAWSHGHKYGKQGSETVKLPPIDSMNLLGQELKTSTIGPGGEQFSVPKYGKGHEDLDTLDHFEQGMLVPETVNPKEVSAPRYGGGHEDLDTVDNFLDGGALNMVPEIEADVFTHYGGEVTRAIADASHLDVNMVPHDFHVNDFDVKYAKQRKSNLRKQRKKHTAIAPGLPPLPNREQRLHRKSKVTAANSRRRANTVPTKLPAVERQRPQQERPRKQRRPKSNEDAGANAKRMPAKKVAKKTAKDTAAGKTAASAPNQTAVKQQSDAAAKAPSKQLQNQPPDGEPQCEGAQQTDGEPTENGEEQNGARTHVLQGYHPGHENLDTHSHFDANFVPEEDGSFQTQKIAQVYGGGHEDKDTYSHFAEDFVPEGKGSMTQKDEMGPSFGAQDLKKHDHMVAYVPDDGVELLTGAVEAPHYGHGHEDLDTFDHFGNGTNVGAEGSMTTFDEYGHHYGGGHEQSDTFSHLGPGMVPIDTSKHSNSYGSVGGSNQSTRKKRIPKKMAVGYPGVVAYRRHELSSDVRFRDGLSKTTGASKVHPLSRFAVDNEFEQKEDDFRLAPWFDTNQNDTRSKLKFPGYVPTHARAGAHGTHELAKSPAGRPGRLMSAV